ncbi:hypothetical protein [Cellulomonas sp. NPDC089187]|uniref:hypothetical protein n=1 Tax=Cellulomonas sp. NPDC089187 TaxID=3154970 RepID=UPI0034447B3E
MAQPVVDRVAVSPSRPVLAVVPRPAPSLTLHEPDVRGVEHRPATSAELLVAAAQADVIRLAFSVVVPGVTALTEWVDLAVQAIAAAGRGRDGVTLLLDLDVVLAPDARTARRKRAELEYLDALSGLTWSPGDTRVVTTAESLRAELHELAERVGVDGLVLHPLTGGERVERELRDLLG